MRYDMRLHGKTVDGRECTCEFSVYADREGELEQEVDKAATQGPWYFKGTEEEVPDESYIDAYHVEWLNKRQYEELEEWAKSIKRGET